MQFKPALYDGSDPSYAPCTGRTRNALFWKAPKVYRDLGYEPTSVKLGIVGKDDDLDMAREARKLTVKMIEKYKVPEHPVGTWAWLITRYETDDISPFQEVKANTQKDYRETNEYWMRAIGKTHINGMIYLELRKIEVAMKKNGREPSFIKRKFSGLRRIARYGSRLGNTDAREVAAVLGEMTFASGAPRTVHPTRAQIRAVIDEADARGQFAFATGLLIQWTYLLRSVDVRGQWLETDGKEGGIIRNGERWQDGLTWDMIDPDLSAFEKVISKTAKRNPEPFRFEITHELRSRLRLLGNGGRIGPVIVSDRYGLPYSRYSWAQAFRRIRDDLKLPKELTIMDTRAGGITEARMMGADPYSLRDAAGHSNLKTTDRYTRGRSEGAAKVVNLRNAKGTR